ncbi:phospholipase A2 [Emericellopsis atlantica]|uniref:Phospholipase A2 n=1 Tax=Emericellopsis atlantica TaxID=2614577 RepID=A0A9P7ZG31_9HYPO|nr:phospholipase A2 [Emericellopsis atlantica]KAG9251335.1 phospholipase A2 [Emericellopsis atlantica]
MKFSTITAFFLPAVAMASPVSPGSTVVKRQTAVTDELLFSISLPAFITRRNARDPPSLDWSSDSCSSSPDNPFGFPFDPACQRHDFGYRNYKAQSRFTDANKLRIDDNFKSDLYGQCAGEGAQGACEALANVYYQAVRWFGREAPATADTAAKVDAEEMPVEYKEAVAAYEAEVKKAQDEGKLPQL